MTRIIAIIAPTQPNSTSPSYPTLMTSFDEFFAVVFRKHKAMIAASNNADDDAD